MAFTEHFYKVFGYHFFTSGGSTSVAAIDYLMKNVMTGSNINGVFLADPDGAYMKEATGYYFNATASVTKAVDDAGITVTGVYTITNTGAEAFTIWKIGMIFNTKKCDNTTTNYWTIERTELEEPLTIDGNGGVGQITYTVRFNYPAFPEV